MGWRKKVYRYRVMFWEPQPDGGPQVTRADCTTIRGAERLIDKLKPGVRFFLYAVNQYGELDLVRKG